MFHEIDTVEEQLTKIMTKCPQLVDTSKGKSEADPMVIALDLYQDLSVTAQWSSDVGRAIFL